MPTSSQTAASPTPAAPLGGMLSDPVRGGVERPAHRESLNRSSTTHPRRSVNTPTANCTATTAAKEPGGGPPPRDPLPDLARRDPLTTGHREARDRARRGRRVPRSAG